MRASRPHHPHRAQRHDQPDEARDRNGWQQRERVGQRVADRDAQVQRGRSTPGGGAVIVKGLAWAKTAAMLATR